MRWEGTIETGRPVYDPLDDGPVVAQRPNRYNQIQNFVGAQHNNTQLTTAEQGVLSSALASAGQMIAQRQQTHHAGQDDTAVGLSIASLIYSVAYGVAMAMITAAIVLVVWLAMGGDEVYYGLFWLFLWGACCLGALAYNRWQGLHFSPAGLAHHEIDSRERVALYAIDKHAAIIERRIGMNAPTEPPKSILGRLLQ